MPHGGYHGTIVSGGNIIQQGDDKGGIQGGLGQAALNIPVNQSAQTAAEAKAAVEAKKEDIKGLTGDPRSLAIQKNIQNQQLNNLLIQQAQAEARDRILSQATPSQVNVDQKFGIVPTLRKADLTGFEGGLFGLNAFATPSIGMSGIDTLRNPLTGEVLFSTDPDKRGSRQDELLKARLGLTTPQYNTFISDLYSANPELFEKTFPLESGKALTPLIVKILEGGLMKDASKLAGNIGSGIGSFIDSATGAMFKPRGGTVRPSDGGAPSDTGGVTSVIDTDKFGNPVLPMGQYSSIPEEYMKGFMESPFYKNVPGGAAITFVTLPDGKKIRFGDTGSASQFRQYLESIGVMQPESTEDLKKVESQPTTISNFDVDKFYASLPQYTQQGIMSPNLSRFTDALRMFPGMA
jgi:hypothetical protein